MNINMEKDARMEEVKNIRRKKEGKRVFNEHQHGEDHHVVKARTAGGVFCFPGLRLVSFN